MYLGPTSLSLPPGSQIPRPGSGFPYAAQTIGSGGTLDVQVSGHGGVPTGAAVAVLNVTAIDESQPGFLSVNPEGQNEPASVSNLNFVAGQTTANLVTVPLSASGAVGIFNHVGNTDVAVDVQGYYGSSSASDGSGLFNTVSPSRALGTLQSGSPIGPDTAVSVPVAADTGVPANADRGCCQPHRGRGHGCKLPFRLRNRDLPTDGIQPRLRHWSDRG